MGELIVYRSSRRPSVHSSVRPHFRRHHIFSNVFDRILFILAGNDDMHESLDEFEIWPDSTTDYRVSCP